MTQDEMLAERLLELTELHRRYCPEYVQILESIHSDTADIRSFILPVRFFKELEFRSVPAVFGKLMDYRDNSGYFFEYDCKDILDIRALCDDKKCQTIAYIGDSHVMLPLILSGVKGIDRIVPMGKTMDFDLIWDGYNLPALLTRTVVLA